MTSDKKENYLQEWLDSTNEHLETVSAQELEDRYLAVKEEVPCSPTISEYLAKHDTPI